MSVYTRPLIGLLDIGQTHGVLDEDFKTLGTDNNFDFITIAPLNAYNLQQLQELFKPLPGDLPISSCTNSGGRILVSRSALVPELEKGAQEGVAKGCAMLLVTCTGDFDLGVSSVPIIFPGNLLRNRVHGIQNEVRRLAVMVPVDEQREPLQSRWEKRLPPTCSVEVVTLSPQSSLLECAKMGDRLKRSGVDTIIMDCMGFSLAQENAVADHIRRVFNAKHVAIDFILSSFSTTESVKS